MGTTSTFFGGGGGGGYSCKLPSIQIGNTTTWCPFYAGCVAVHVIGAGSGGNESFCGGGGGSGGYTRKLFEVTTSDCYCIFIGDGGGPNQSGGCSLFCNTSGAAVCLRAFGGCCNSTPCQGGYYGCSLGGDVCRCGSCGGSGGSSSQEWGGGAGVNLFFDCTGCTCGGSAGGGSSKTAGGGGGVGGQGADAGSSCCVYPVFGGGGGSGGPGCGRCHCYDVPSAHGGISLGALPPGEERFWSFIPNWGAGGSYSFAGSLLNSACLAFAETRPGIGGGGAGGAAQGINGQGGNLFGGGGGGYAGGPGGCGAGGGGGLCNDMGRGGNGVIFIEYLSVEV